MNVHRKGYVPPTIAEQPLPPPTPLSRTAKWISSALIFISLVMLPWLLVLGATLKGQAHVRFWSTTWIGLDCMEIIGLITTAMLLRWRDQRVIVAATFTATTFFVDAWFDVMLSQGGWSWYEALTIACLFEIPISLICIGIALTAPAWITDSGSAHATALLTRLQRQGTAIKHWITDR